MSEWPSALKVQMAVVLTKEFTSPEKDGEDGSRLRIPFVWESSALAKRKLELDNIYVSRVLKPMQRAQLSSVCEHPTALCESGPPSTAPGWTVSKRFKSQ